MLSASARISDVRHQLRIASTDAHSRVDAAFSKFDLTDARDYQHLLRAFYRVVPKLEACLIDSAVWSGWHPRGHLLFADLAVLEAEHLRAQNRTPQIVAASPWAIQYILEGSRLGGRVLVRRVGAGMPTTYLSAFIEPYDWLRFKTEFQAEADAQDSDWLDQTINATRSGFAMFEEAAEAEFARMTQHPGRNSEPASSVSRQS